MVSQRQYSLLLIAMPPAPPLVAAMIMPIATMSLHMRVCIPVSICQSETATAVL
jgi:hypothetical protein